eukprot:CAMPEP_0170493854 /NCGR_PEP_ID=MMETSP0208-20121228/14309_1 /TAXON_ID=197538 /ORGANISM="Strombidium inclinatum, Strain S3" /LENGTH=79 /DNA_ID=CAMNT_0010769831 /DNA_START=204 /DNA_END=443 /DNA_ORIENTATION=+
MSPGLPWKTSLPPSSQSPQDRSSPRALQEDQFHNEEPFPEDGPPNLAGIQTTQTGQRAVLNTLETPRVRSQKQHVPQPA